MPQRTFNYQELDTINGVYQSNQRKPSQLYYIIQLYVCFCISMTYLEEIKVEAKSILMKLTSVMEGQVAGHGLMERGR